MTTKVKYCPKCRKDFEYTEEDTYWFEGASYGSVKLVKCPRCERVFVLKTIIDRGFSN